MRGAGREFIVGLRERYVRFESGARKRERQERDAFERQRRAHRAERKIVPPPFTASELMRRNKPPKAPGT